MTITNTQEICNVKLMFTRFLVKAGFLTALASCLLLAVAQANEPRKAALPDDTQIKISGAAQEQTAPVAGQTKNLPRLVDLGAKQCMACKEMAPILADLSSNYSAVMQVEFIDVWQKANAEKAKGFGIRLIPTQIFFSAQGKEIFRHEGFMSKEDILAKWKELGYEMRPNPPQSGKD